VDEAPVGRFLDLGLGFLGVWAQFLEGFLREFKLERQGAAPSTGDECSGLGHSIFMEL
jgi:hypothetical protein